jgi:hypothetical protein
MCWHQIKVCSISRYLVGTQRHCVASWLGELAARQLTGWLLLSIARSSECWHPPSTCSYFAKGTSVTQAFPTGEMRALCYEKKRHQAGRAFECARLRSTCYSFGRTVDFTSDQGRGVAEFASLEWPPWLWHWTDEEEREKLMSSGAAEQLPRLPCPHCERCGGVVALAAPAYQLGSAAQGSGSLPLWP